VRTSEKSATIAAALYAVHRDLENPRKDAKGQVRGRADYRYLSLPALIDHARKALKEASVAVIQEVTGEVGAIGVTTTFLHLTGEFIEVGPLTMPAQGGPQEIGSAITYARRYALAAALNLAADEDDDASAASSPARFSGADKTASGRDGAADKRGAGGESGAYGEGAAGEPPASQTRPGEEVGRGSSPSDKQRWMDEWHPGKPHRMKQSEKAPTILFCITRPDQKCPYTERTKEAADA
jgi:hypothetical protein